jgi:hypothetical protein
MHEEMEHECKKIERLLARFCEFQNQVIILQALSLQRH